MIYTETDNRVAEQVVASSENEDKMVEEIFRIDDI